MNIENTIQTACGLEGKIVRNGTINCTATRPKELPSRPTRGPRERTQSHRLDQTHSRRICASSERESKCLEGLRRGRQTLVGKAIR